MKNLLILFLLSSLVELRAQIITFDYHSRTYTSNRPFAQHGAMVSYRIININSFAQKVKINGQAISMTTKMPAQLATLFSIEADKELENTADQIEEMIKTQEDANVKLKTAINHLVTDCRDYYRKAEKIKDALALEERLAETMKDKSFCNVAKMTHALSDSKVDATSIGNLETDLDNFEAAYDKVHADYQQTAKIADEVEEKDKAARIRTALGQIKKDYEALEAQYKKTLSDIDKLFGQAMNSDNYEVTSLPLKLAGSAGEADEVAFEVQIDDEKFPMPDAFNVDGGIKVDFSVGPVANFTSNDQYFFGADNVLQQRNKTRYLTTITPTVSSMMHVYCRKHRGVALGGMFGVNAEVKELTDINLGFLAGASAVMGRSQKVIISTGVSYLNVNRLKEGQYKVGTVYNDTKIEDVTERALRPSWFVAVSLSIAKRKVLTP